MYGKKRTDESKIKSSNSMKVKVTEELRKIVSKRFKGKKLSIEHRAKISQRNSERIITQDTRDKLSKLKSGVNHHMYGKHHTLEARKKMSIKIKNHFYIKKLINEYFNTVVV